MLTGVALSASQPVFALRLELRWSNRITMSFKRTNLVWNSGRWCNVNSENFSEGHMEIHCRRPLYTVGKNWKARMSYESKPRDGLRRVCKGTWRVFAKFQVSQQEELNTSKETATHFNQVRKTFETVRGRAEKWFKMICYGFWKWKKQEAAVDCKGSFAVWINARRDKTEEFKLVQYTNCAIHLYRTNEMIGWLCLWRSTRDEADQSLKESRGGRKESYWQLRNHLERSFLAVFDEMCM